MQRKINRNIPLYGMVKRHILDKIDSGKLAPGDRLPSENKLVDELKVSRMTVNRALRELANDGYIDRIGGVGTFVSEPSSQGHILEIRNIAEEIKERGHLYTAKVIQLDKVIAPIKVANMLELSKGAPVFHSQIVHYENKIPIQLENRYVTPAFAPNYLKVDFSVTNTTEYLLGVAALQEVEHIIHAILPDKRTARLLKIELNHPCLLLERRTWSSNTLVTYSLLYHPGLRYTLGDRFAPRLH